MTTITLEDFRSRRMLGQNLAGTRIDPWSVPVGTSLHNEEFAAIAAVPPPPTLAPRKDDGGKLDMTLLDDMPRALAAVVEVMQWAITKKEPVPYGRGSWLGVEADRYRAALMRHQVGAGKQASDSPQKQVPSAPRFQKDEETNLLHLAHTACSALMALENTIRELEQL